jgi:hypothetical protein
MKKTAFSCSVFLLMAIAVMAAAPDNERNKTASRDVSGLLVGSFTFEVFAPYGPWDFISHGDATGTLTHPGLVKLYTAHTPNPSGDGTLVNTEFRIVEASGDEIRGTYSNGIVTEVPTELTEADPYHLGVHYYEGKATFVISGGTGRYAHARGEIDATFFEALNWTTWDCSVAWALEGRIKH